MLCYTCLFVVFRTYSLVPKDVGQFLALSKEKFHLRTKHSVLLGQSDFIVIFYYKTFPFKLTLWTNITSMSKLTETNIYFTGYWTAELGGLNQVVHFWKYGMSVSKMTFQYSLHIFQTVCHTEPQWEQLWQVTSSGKLSISRKYCLGSSIKITWH